MDQWQAIGESAECADAFPPLRKTTSRVRPPAHKPGVQLPDFREPVVEAQYAQLGGLNAGSKAAQKRQRQWIEKGYPLEVILKETGIVLRLVPPGEFLMGASPGDSEASDEEKPQHQVTIPSPLYVAKFPVTQQQWRVVAYRIRELAYGGLSRPARRELTAVANGAVPQAVNAIPTRPKSSSASSRPCSPSPFLSSRRNMSIQTGNASKTCAPMHTLHPSPFPPALLASSSRAPWLSSPLLWASSPPSSSANASTSSAAPPSFSLLVSQ